MPELLAGISATGLAYIWAVTVAATVLRSFTGFGFALAAVPGYALLLTPAQSVVLTATLSVVLGLQNLPQYRGRTGLRSAWRVYLFAVCGTGLGILLLRALSVDAFRLAIGLVTIVASLLLSRFHPRRRKPGTLAQVVTGLSSGLINGGFAIPGPPIIIYSMATEADPARSRAFMIAFFTFSSAIALAGFALAGLVSQQALVLAALSYPALFAGDKLGFALFRRHGDALYRRIAVAVLLLIGLSLVMRSLAG